MSGVSENPWTTLATTIIYTNSWLRLREDTVIRPDGREGIYGVVEMPPASVGIVALNDAACSWQGSLASLHSRGEA